jgi:hypothetical protein
MEGGHYVDFPDDVMGHFSGNVPLFRGPNAERMERQGEPKPSLLKRQRIARIKVLSDDSLPVHLCEDGGARSERLPEMRSPKWP